MKKKMLALGAVFAVFACGLAFASCDGGRVHSGNRVGRNEPAGFYYVNLLDKGGGSDIIVYGNYLHSRRI